MEPKELVEYAPNPNSVHVNEVQFRGVSTSSRAKNFETLDNAFSAITTWAPVPRTISSLYTSSGGLSNKQERYEEALRVLALLEYNVTPATTSARSTKRGPTTASPIPFVRQLELQQPRRAGGGPAVLTAHKSRSYEDRAFTAILGEHSRRNCATITLQRHTSFHSAPSFHPGFPHASHAVVNFHQGRIPKLLLESSGILPPSMTAG